MSHSLWPRGLQHARLPCPSLSPGICSNSCPLSWWYHPIISSSPAFFSSCLQSFPASRSFPVSWLFTSSGQSIATSASESVRPVNTEGWLPLRLTGLILLSKEISRVFPSTTVWKHQSLSLSLLYGPTLTSMHDYWKNRNFDHTDLGQQSNISTFLICCPKFVIAFLPRSKQASFNFIIAVVVCSDFGAQENKICHCFHFFFIWCWSWNSSIWLPDAEN